MAKAKPNTVAVATQLAQPLLEQQNLTLWDVRFEKEGSVWFLRYFIDKPGGVTIDDCEQFSRAISPVLDSADPIEQSYYLEVSSPGIDRQLTKPWHFQQYLGAVVEVRLIRPVEGQRDFVGELVAFDESLDSLTIALDDEIGFTCNRKEAAFVRLYVDDLDDGGNLE